MAATHEEIRARDVLATYNGTEVKADAVLRMAGEPGQTVRFHVAGPSLAADSPVPLRETLRLLEAERFVSLHLFQGAVVTPLSAEELRELADMALALQTLARSTRGSSPGPRSRCVGEVRPRGAR